jgi:exodeoxyribonuclease VII small subunit
MEEFVIDKKEPTFEEALARLEEIVRALDGGDAPLDKSLALFEEGVALVKLCSGKLDSVEQRVKILVRGEDGKATEQDFRPSQN